MARLDPGTSSPFVIWAHDLDCLLPSVFRILEVNIGRASLLLLTVAAASDPEHNVQIHFNEIGARVPQSCSLLEGGRSLITTA
jgi:hypothetical protein